MNPTSTAAIIAHVIKLTINSKDPQPLTDWLIRLMMSGVDSPDCLSAEMTPPLPPEETAWKLVQLFRTSSHRNVWLQSEAYKKLSAEFKQLAANDQATLVEHDLQDTPIHGTVAAAIVTDVKPEMEKHYHVWEAKVQALQAKYPGYRGTFVQPPSVSNPDRWTTMVRFDTPEDLENWFTSAERKERLPEAEHFTKKIALQKITNSFPGWFPTDEQGKGPPNWKTALLVLLGLYPTVMLEIKFLNPVLTGVGIGPALGNFVGNTLSVAFTTWVTIPLAIKGFKPWLLPDTDKPMRINLIGCAALAGLFIIEIGLLWHLL